MIVKHVQLEAQPGPISFGAAVVMEYTIQYLIIYAMIAQLDSSRMIQTVLKNAFHAEWVIINQTRKVGTVIVVNLDIIVQI